MEIENPKNLKRQQNTEIKLLSYVDSDDELGTYYCESSHDLLSQEEETELTNRLDAGRNFLGKRDYDHMILTDDARAAFNTIVTMNLRLVNDIAKKKENQGVELLDLFQAGNIGLMKATSKFDLEFGFRFSTYAIWWIRQAITREIADHGRTIRIPVHQLETLKMLYKTIAYLTQKNKEAPNVSEVAEYLEMDPEKVKLLLQRSILPQSLDKQIDEDDNSEAEYGDYVQDNSVRVEIQCGENILKEKLNEAFKAIKCEPMYILIVKFRHGLVDGKIYSLGEIGQKFGLSVERVKQIEANVLSRLRFVLKKEKNYFFDKQD